MKLIKKILLILPIFLINIIPSKSQAVNNDIVIYLPQTTWQEDVNIESTQVQTKESTIFEYIQKINEYLWFWIAWVAMFVLMVSWLKFITSWWKDTKKAWVLALSCIIAITVAMLSYTIVNIVVNLF